MVTLAEENNFLVMTSLAGVSINFIVITWGSGCRESYLSFKGGKKTKVAHSFLLKHLPPTPNLFVSLMHCADMKDECSSI